MFCHPAVKENRASGRRWSQMFAVGGRPVANRKYEQVTQVAAYTYVARDGQYSGPCDGHVEA